MDEPNYFTIAEIREFLSDFWSKDSERWEEGSSYEEWLEEVREAKESELFDLLLDLDYRVFSSEEERLEWFDEMGLLEFEEEEEEEQASEEEIFKIILEQKQKELNSLYDFIEALQKENNLLDELLRAEREQTKALEQALEETRLLKEISEFELEDIKESFYKYQDRFNK